MLGLKELFTCAKFFADAQSHVNHKELLGITDGKTIGTFIEHQFKTYLQSYFPDVKMGNSAQGIDLPDVRLNCDIKVTSFRKPQSSCPYRETRQKIYGLGYNLLLFIYDKKDDGTKCLLDFLHVALIEQERTSDYILTKQIRDMLAHDANIEDIISFFEDKSLPGDEITHRLLAEEVMKRTPLQGYLTISNALQWRLKYSRVIESDNGLAGVLRYDR